MRDWGGSPSPPSQKVRHFDPEKISHTRAKNGVFTLNVKNGPKPAKTSKRAKNSRMFLGQKWLSGQLSR